MMILIVLIISVLLGLMLSGAYSARKQIYANRIDAAYIQMEIYLARHRVCLNPSMRKFLIGHKAYYENKKLADFEIIGGLYYSIPDEVMQKGLKNYDAVVAAHPELGEISKRLSQNVTHLATMHMLVNPPLLLLFFKYVATAIGRTLILHRREIIQHAHEVIRIITSREPLIVVTGKINGMSVR